MAFALSDRVKETTTTTGTGTVTLAGAATGFQTFSSGVGTSNTTYYCIAGQGTSEWEVGFGTLATSSTLARTVVFASSNSNSAVNFSAGTKDVFVTLPASAGYTGASAEVFTANGTFTIPTGITRVKMTVVGGGGGGGGGQNSGCCNPAAPGGGGGGGGSAIKWFTSLTPGNTLTVTRGAGGGGGGVAGNGTSGGTSSVASGTETITTVSATGGAFGLGTSTSGLGGAGSSGDLNMPGGDGFNTSIGGTSLMAGNAQQATAGNAYGGGGGGADASSSAGEAGANGVIFFEW